MAAQNRPAAKKGWGSMLSSAVAGLESRLDTILADGPDNGDKTKIDESQNAVEPQKAALVPSTTTSGSTSRDASRARGNDRLAEKLARITAQRSRLGVDSINRAPSSERTASARTSIDIKREEADVDKNKAEAEQATAGETVSKDEDIQVPAVEESAKEDETTTSANTNTTLLASTLPINPARKSIDSPRRSVELATSDGFDSSRPSIDFVNGNSQSTVEIEAEMERMRGEYETAEQQRQEEMHAHLERIDALQAKLQYLAKETVAAAKQANATTASGSLDSKLAQKDEQIALLMEEGQQLSKTELRHLQTIKLRTQGLDSEKAVLDMRKKLDKAERSEMEHKHKVRRAEAAERSALEKAKQVPLLQEQLDTLRADRDKANDQINSLNLQLQEAEKRAAQAIQAAQNKALEADKNRIADLENELEDSQIEKKLAEDRAQAEIKKVQEDTDRQRERWSVTELELTNEIKSVEARLEAMRARIEEQSTEVDGAESGAKLLRQIELLQNQYNLAKTNWETIEGSLNARLVAMEKDRDEAARREADVRKKARDAGSKARLAAEELESTTQQVREKDAELTENHSKIDALQRSLHDANTTLADAKADFERQRRIWESELAARLEEEKARWQRGARPVRMESLPLSRKTSGLDIGPRRGPPKAGDFPGFERSSTRRSSVVPSRTAATPDRELLSPPFSTHGSIMNFPDMNGMPPAEPEIDDDFDHESSPHQTINDIVSTNVSGAGPSVQLVERMSAAVRKLEGEKAAHKDELARLGAQRDEARDQIVLLMREVEEARSKKSRVVELEKDMQGVQQRYDACLEMLGEREEEVDELKADVVELKKIYRELVEEKVSR
ncbi:hypothetical protein AMS68_007449 [Peltaster fructicola]|uniref:TATA element modulatory factor 1 TATA binding domain-containing protein n=1 Tax=Peltaster fructicola TaxID=286661 RepID=A0A6H0Y4H7_9PEZI|nr:hypothetical protein AMS68_007449 [Peltaster fructicola]